MKQIFLNFERKDRECVNLTSGEHKFYSVGATTEQTTFFISDSVNQPLAT